MKIPWMLLCVLLTVTSAGLSGWVYANRAELLPERVPTHWNIRGDADQWKAREDMGPELCIGPGVMLLFCLLVPVFPWLSPKQFEVDLNKRLYHYCLFLVVALMGYLNLVLLGAYMRPDFASLRWLLGGMAVFFMLLGNVLGKLPRNFWIGVRTPWTLASNLVWVKTHRLAAWLCVAGGLLCLVLVMLDASPYLFIVVLGLALGTPVIYSLVIYKKLAKTGELMAEPQM